MSPRDYYEVLGVDRAASADEIKRAYRKLARKYHPDVSKEPDAEVRFKALGEAYKVLKTAESRAAYDRMGSDWKAGQDFQPPPNWDAGFEFGGAGGADGAGYAGNEKSFSDLFESLFGKGAGPSQQHRRSESSRGEDHHAKVMIDLEDAYLGAQRSISLQMPAFDSAGNLVNQLRTLNVSIPKGVRAGQRLRLVGQGSPGASGMAAGAGDLYLEIVFKPHAGFRVDKRDVYLDLPVSPWEATLGATVTVPMPDGAVQLSVPAASTGGRKLRLKGKGIPSHPPGDLYAVLNIALPPADTEAAKAAYREMEVAFDFDPRAHLKG